MKSKFDSRDLWSGVFIVFILAVLAFVAMTCQGCANLSDKSVILGAGGIGGKAGIVVDPNTGYPLPCVLGGEGDGAWVDHKRGDGDVLVIEQEKSLWSSEIARRSIKYIGKNGGLHVTVSADLQVITIDGGTDVDTGSVNTQLVK
jgi:hypothetical protein